MRADRGSAGFPRAGRPTSPRPVTAPERRLIEALVERLIDVLDRADGEPDLEPSLGWSGTFATGRLDFDELLNDLEDEHDGREPRFVPARLDTAPRRRGTAL